MLKSFKIILTFLIFLPSTSLAVTPAQEVLDKVSAKIASLGSYEVVFAVEAEGETFQGTYIVSGSRYNVSAADVNVICDGKTRYEINSLNKEILADNINPNDRNIFINPPKAFDFTANNFIASLKEPVVYGKVQVEIVSLKLTEKSYSIKEITLAVDKNTSLPVQISYTADGVNGEIVLKIVSVTRCEVSDHMFKLDIKDYPGYELVDFRD